MGHNPWTDMDRRRFAALAGAAVASGAGAAFAQAKVVETDVKVKTQDGTCDAVLFHPEGKGRHPGVLLWPDAGGLRQVKRDMSRRLAGHGYVVLVVNPYYRVGAAPGLSNDQKTAARMGMNAQTAETDSKAFIAYLDKRPEVSKAKMGVQGYCMGGALSVRTAAAVPGRIGAACSFHGGNGLVTKMDTSPHLLIPKTKARYIFATAKNDDMTDPTVKNTLRETLLKAGLPAFVDVFQANHGWCVPDGQTYNQAEAERAWVALTDVYQRSLV
jgi:carboxymethylenebutenolidase